MIRVLRRQVGWDLALVGLVTLVLVALTLGWPRALDRLVREDLMAQVAALPVTQRDLGLTVPHRLVDLASLDAAGSRAVLAGADAWTDEQIAGAGPQLSAVLGPPEHEITRTPYFVDLSPSAPGVSYMKVTLSAGPRRDDLRLVAGAWPEAPDVSPWLTAAAGYIPPPIELEVVVSSDTARWMGWQVGEVRGSRDPSYPVALRLTGLVEAVDPGSGVWQHLSGVLEPAIDRDDNAGWTVHGVAYVDPDATAVLMVPRGAQLDAWYPLDVSAVGAADRDALGAELAGVRASTGLRTGVSAVLATTEGRERTATTVLQVLVTGLVGVAAGALWLVATMVVERRREALLLLRARGASVGRVALLVAVQAGIAAAPGAAIGAAAALAVPGTTHPADAVLPLALTLGATALVAAAAARAQTSRTRSHRSGRWRAVAEVLVLAATGVALGAGAGADPMLPVLPVLVGLSAALVALRLYPWPARAALRMASRRRDLGAFLGVARAARVPAAGLITVLALTLGVATAGLALTTVTTVATATERSAVRLVGADLRLDLAWTAQNTGLRPDQVDLARAVEGVEALAAVSNAGTVTLRSGRTSRTVHLWVVDGGALAEVQAGQPDSPADRRVGGDRALVAGDLPTGAVSIDSPRGPLDLTAAEADDVPGTTVGTGWALVDRETWAGAGGTPPVNRLLVRLTPGAAPADVADAIAGALDARLTATSREQALASVARGALVTGVRDATLLVAAASLALVALVLVLVLVADAPARGRASALLATLGAPRAVHRRLVLAEVLGPVLVGTVAGGAAGAVLPRAVLRAADLRPFTGALDRPPIAVDPVLVGAAAGGLLVVVLVGTVLAVAAGRRTRPAAVLREGARG